MRNAWLPLPAPFVPEFLYGLGVTAAPRATAVTRLTSTRNAVFRAAYATGSDFFVKQFRGDDAGLASFRREWHFASSGFPALPPVAVDDQVRAIVYPAIGATLAEVLPHNDDAVFLGGIGDTLTALRRRSVDEIREPPIFERLLGPVSGSLAQRRLLAVVAADPKNLAQLRELRAHWQDAVDVSHGDLKIEHVVVGADSRCWLIDWESVGRGPAEWDAASLVQSLFALILSGASAWRPGFSKLARDLLPEDATMTEFAPFVAIRLWQTALEWSIGRARVPYEAGRVLDLGLRFAHEQSALSSVVESMGEL